MADLEGGRQMADLRVEGKWLTSRAEGKWLTSARREIRGRMFKNSENPCCFLNIVSFVLSCFNEKACISCIILTFFNLRKCLIFKNNENPWRFLNMLSCVPSCFNEKACISCII